MKQTTKMLLLVLGVMLFGMARAQERSLEVRGEAAPSKNQSAIEVRQLAILDALRNAVEIGVGVFLSSETITKNYQLLEDKIFKRSQGFARVEKIINEGATSNGRYQVQVLAIVSSQKLVTNLRTVIKRFQDPRIGVVLRETLEGKPLGGAASIVLSKALVDMGFRVLDQAQLEQKISRDKLLAAAETPKALASIGAQLKLDVVLVGAVRNSKQNNETVAASGQVSVSSVLELKLLDVLTAQIIWTDQANNPEVGLSLDETASRASRNAAQQLIEPLVNRLLAWIQNGLTPPVFVLKIAGFKTFSAYNQFMQRLGTQKGVLNVQGREFNNAQTEIEVEFDGPPDVLAVLLEKLGVVVIGLAGREIRAKVK